MEFQKHRANETQKGARKGIAYSPCFIYQVTLENEGSTKTSLYWSRKGSMLFVLRPTNDNTKPKNTHKKMPQATLPQYNQGGEGGSSVCFKLSYKGCRQDQYSSETVNLARPLARREANTRRPFAVAIRARKPCLFFLLRLEG